MLPNSKVACAFMYLPSISLRKTMTRESCCFEIQVVLYSRQRRFRREQIDNKLVRLLIRFQGSWREEHGVRRSFA